MYIILYYSTCKASEWKHNTPTVHAYYTSCKWKEMNHEICINEQEARLHESCWLTDNTLKDLKAPFKTSASVCLFCLHLTSCYTWSAAVDYCQHLTTQLTASKLGVDEKTQLDFLMGLSHEWLQAEFYFLVHMLKREPLDCSTHAAVTKSWEPQNDDASVSMEDPPFIIYLDVVGIVRVLP